MRAVPPDPSRWPQSLASPPFDQFADLGALFAVPAFPAPAELNPWLAAAWPADLGPPPCFVDQAGLADGLHFEARIGERRQISTRARNWHDLYSAAAWMRFPRVKHALNRLQCVDLAAPRPPPEPGRPPQPRTRRQQSLTHVDEAGLFIASSDPALLDRLEAHDWPALYGEVAAWCGPRPRIECRVFGHALYELLMDPHLTLAGKAILVEVPKDWFTRPAATREAALDQAIMTALLEQDLAADPKDLPSLPLAGIPDWRAGNHDPEFLRSAPCFRPRPEGREYRARLRIGR
ncbi:MAG: DUF3025 domain-containing protein [Xanthomonadales bacterium]|jgi:hypothetical protein|nr:DUF3025 domain-containing protein [Xanthomonadales bacterium]